MRKETEMFTYSIGDKFDKAMINFHRILGASEYARKNRENVTMEDFHRLLNYIDKLEKELDE